ncbi:MAG: enoyl-CoA hydratase [Alphaproteobacteria bacterium]
MSWTDRMIAEKNGAIGWMIFNNPRRHNAISLEMWEAIPKILDGFEANPEIRVIVTRGAGGKAFISGADISEFEELRASKDGVARYDRIADAATHRLQISPKPTLAMIRGYCIGGGVEIALACDLRFAAESARFGIPAAKLGLGYGHDGVEKLLAAVGPAATKEIFYTARQFTAAQALHMGLINRVLAEDELESAVRETCESIAANAPLTINAVKRTIAELTKARGGVDRGLCQALVDRCFESEDYVEGRAAFAEKRKPVFRGR